MGAGGVEAYEVWLAGARPGWLAPGAYTLKARLGGRWLRTGDGVSAAWVRACGRSRWRWARYVAAERRAVRAAERVVAISPMVARELADWYGRGDCPVVLNPLLVPVAPPERRERGCVVLVGHGWHRKGLDVWLAAAAELPGLHTHVIGADQRPGRWRRRAAALGIGDRLSFHGVRPAASWIAGAALLVHPARYEPYGNVIAEAVAAGTPAIASDACGASCLLHPSHVWSWAGGAADLARRARRALDAPRPPIAQPPSEATHLRALREALLG